MFSWKLSNYLHNISCPRSLPDWSPLTHRTSVITHLVSSQHFLSLSPLEFLSSLLYLSLAPDHKQKQSGIKFTFLLVFSYFPPDGPREREERVEREREREQMSVLDAGDAARAGPAWPRPPHGMLAVRSRDERWWSIRVGRQPGQTSGQPQLILDLNYGFTTSIWSNYRPAVSQQQPGNN